MFQSDGEKFGVRSRDIDCPCKQHANDSYLISVIVPVLLTMSAVSTVVVSPKTNVTVTVRCPVLIGSYPKPRVLWRRQGKFVSVGETINLTLTKDSEMGQLDCIASNGYGGAKVKHFNLVRDEEGSQRTPGISTAASETSRGSSLFSAVATAASSAKMKEYTRATSVTAMILTTYCFV